MDDTSRSRNSDVAASAATRKRRSSILKSQRPPRTPFCELEFNVVTPTDTTKSRRVSFSRRTGVAEFATNEATTTWKNFYEEHNKTLESSGNDSDINHRKHSISHLGKRIFDQQFEEVEAVDFMGTLNPGTSINSSSINHNNFAQVECTESKLSPSQNNLELSALTETQSKLFGDTLANTYTSGTSGHIDVNFSTIQHIGEKDDLDEIQKDLQRNGNVVCRGLFTGQDLSEYIEVDLNMTHTAIANDEYNMSITDTIHCPKVQEVSKNCSIDKKNISNNDWITDKENIVLNPYIAPRESANFAIAKMSDEVLVFDGKKLIVESENSEICCQPVVSGPCEQAPQRKTIVLNCNDDLPNFLEEQQIFKKQSGFANNPEAQQSCILEDMATHKRLEKTQNKYKTIIFGDGLDDLSLTQAVPNNIPNIENLQTIIYDDDVGNISITHVLPSNIVDKEKNRTSVYEKENVNMSMTQAVSANIIIQNESNEKRKTIVFENEACDISMTEAIPKNIVLDNDPKRRPILEDSTANMSVLQLNLDSKNDSQDLIRTVLCEDNAENISDTNSIISTSSSDKYKPTSAKKDTMVFDSDIDNLSVTQALRSHIILPQRVNTTSYGIDGNTSISMTQAIPSNILLQSENIVLHDDPNLLRTIICGDETKNLSITQPVTNGQVIYGFGRQQCLTTEPSNINSLRLHEDIIQTETLSLNKVPTQDNHANSRDVISENKQRTVVFQNETVDISMTQAVPVKQKKNNVNVRNEGDANTDFGAVHESSRKESPINETVVLENEKADISLTQGVSINNDGINEKNKIKDNYYNTINSASQQVRPSLNNIDLIINSTRNENSNIQATTNNRSTVIYENDTTDKPNTHADSMNQDFDDKEKETQNIIPTNVSLFKKIDNKRRTVIFEKDDADISITQTVPTNKVIETVQKENHNFDETNSTLYERHPAIFHNVNAEMSKLQAISMNQLIDTVQNENNDFEETNLALCKDITNTKTAAFKNDPANLCMTRPVAINQIINFTKNESQIIEVTHTTLDQGLNNNNGSAKINDFDITVTKTVHQVLYTQENELKYNSIKNEQVLENETKQYGSITNKKNPHVVYDDESDISMTRAISSNIILSNGQEKKSTLILESVKHKSLLENKDLFAEGRLTEDTTVSKIGAEDHKEKDDHYISDLRGIKIGEKDAIVCNNDDRRLTKLVSDNFSYIEDISGVNIEEGTGIRSKPIPPKLTAFQQGSINKSHCEKDSSKTDGTMATKTFTDVLVYQSMTSNTQVQRKTDKGNFQIISQDTVASEEINSSSPSLAVTNSVRIPTLVEQESQNHSTTTELVATSSSKHSDVKTFDSKLSNSILNELLNMSEVSFEGTEDKELMAKINAAIASMVQTDAKESTDTMFYITKDSDEDVQTGLSDASSGILLNKQKTKQIQNESPLSIEYKDEDDRHIVRDVQKTLSIIKNVLRESHIAQIPPKQHYEHNEDKGNEVSLDTSKRKSHKSFKMANDTNELLEMLSDFTDTGNFRALGNKKGIKKKTESSSLENKMKLSEPEPSQLNRVLKRQSSVLSREDLLNNMSMASTALQKSRSDFDKSDTIEEVRETPNVSKDQRNSVKLSNNDVIKHFEDNSIIEDSESIQTPLKKTAFGEVSYMKDTKSKVIPNFLHNVSDGVKELMDELVKPTSDMQPFNKPLLQRRALKANASTCSTEIQANLLTSSQIDLNTDLYSTSNSVSDINRLSSADISTESANNSMSKTLTSLIKSTPICTQYAKSSEIDMKSDDTEDKFVKTTIPQTTVSSKQLGSVLIFDQHNPLNNVLLVPTPAHAIDIHRYDPFQPNELEKPQSNEIDDLKPQEDRVISQYRVEVPSAVVVAQHEHADKSVTQSGTSVTSKPMSIDHYTEPDVSTFRDIEINTVIVMKANDELLQASSSLTLVDDGAGRQHIHSLTDTSQRDTARSPVKVIYKFEEPSFTKIDSDLTSTDGIETPLKPKKRVYSPGKQDKHESRTFSNLDMTPKPLIKMQKRSVSPDYKEPRELLVENVKFPEPVNRDKSPARQKSQRKIRGNKPGTTITVQQLTMMVHAESNRVKEHKALEQKESSTIEPRSGSDSRDVFGIASNSEISSSFASSNDLRDANSLGCASVSGKPSRVEWLPMSTSHLIVDDIRSGDDLVGIIDAMPFMGSHDCQWECVSGSVWSLLLLHSRLRLTVRFASEPRLHLDTPVLNIELETLHQDKKNSIAYLCVIFAAEMMRYYISRGCSAAGDVSKLVRRLSGAARLAGQWARAMHDARARLAYSLSHDGWLALKVANTSCRTMWEVTMRLELVVENARAAPWPRACGVRVTRVLAPPGAASAPPDIERALAPTPRDWGHVPRTIWKVFRYLKHKKREDDLMHL